MTMTPKDRAKRSSQAMWREDDASQLLGMSLIVARHHCNGHGICHGGVIFSLADSTFAFACNSRNQSTVAQHNMISFIAPGREGDGLTATATEVSLTGRSGIYIVRVRNQKNETVAEMRGMSRAIRSQLFDETTLGGDLK